MSERLDEPSADEERELLGLWLSRLMFNGMVGWPEETRSFEEFLADSHNAADTPGEATRGVEVETELTDAEKIGGANSNRLLRGQVASGLSHCAPVSRCTCSPSKTYVDGNCPVHARGARGAA